MNYRTSLLASPRLAEVREAVQRAAAELSPRERRVLIRHIVAIEAVGAGLVFEVEGVQRAISKCIDEIVKIVSALWDDVRTFFSKRVGTEGLPTQLSALVRVLLHL